MSRELLAQGKGRQIRVGERRKGGDRRLNGQGRLKDERELESGPLSSAPPVAPAHPKLADALTRAELTNVLSSVLDKLHRGALVIDSSGIVHVRNASAAAMAQTGDAFRIVKGQFCLRSAAQQKSLEKFLSAEDREPALAIKVERSGGLPPFRVLVSTLPPCDRGNRKLPLFAVFIYQPSAGRKIPATVLRELYDLTPAESRLVMRLFDGESLATASAGLGISTLTARSHLKHVFNKCEVQSQGELLQLLSLGPRTY